MEEELDTLPRRVASEIAALQDKQVTRLLDKHMLKGRTSEELSAAGYVLTHTSSGDPFIGPIKHTWTLCKIVDRTELSIRVNVGLES